MEHRNKKVKPNASSSDWNMMKQNKFINILVNWNRLVLSLYWILTTVLIKWNMVVNFFNDDFYVLLMKTCHFWGKNKFTFFICSFMFLPSTFFLAFILYVITCVAKAVFFNQHVHHIKTLKKIVLTWEFLLYCRQSSLEYLFCRCQSCFIGAYVHIRV